MSTIREGRWDCPHCRTIGIRGRDLTCPSCGSVRPEDIQFYLPEDAPEVTDEALRQRAQDGADWICAYCGTSNVALGDPCRQCGAPRAESDRRQRVREYGMDEVPRSGDDPIPSAQPKSSPTEESPPRSFFARFWGRIVAAITAIVVLICGGSAALLQHTTHEAVTVTGLSWERTIAVEAYRTERIEDWSLPPDARLIRQREEIHHYEQVLDHYETRTRDVSDQVQVGTETYVCGQRDLGNGMFEDRECSRPIYETRWRTETYEEPIYRDEPVYRTKYTYDIDQWVYDRTERRAGTNSDPSEWPSVSEFQGVPVVGRSERAGERTETYTVSVVSQSGTSYDVVVDAAEWERYRVGQSLTLTFDIFGTPLEFAPE